MTIPSSITTSAQMQQLCTDLKNTIDVSKAFERTPQTTIHMTLQCCWFCYIWWTWHLCAAVRAFFASVLVSCVKFNYKISKLNKCSSKPVTPPRTKLFCSVPANDIYRYKNDFEFMGHVPSPIRSDNWLFTVKKINVFKIYCWLVLRKCNVVLQLSGTICSSSLGTLRLWLLIQDGSRPVPGSLCRICRLFEPLLLLKMW